MAVLDRPKTIACRKCGRDVRVAWALRKGLLACPGCKEPIPELFDLSRCSWGEGDLGAGGE